MKTARYFTFFNFSLVMPFGEHSLNNSLLGLLGLLVLTGMRHVFDKVKRSFKKYLLFQVELVHFRLLTASWEKQKQHWSKKCWWSPIHNLVIQKLRSRQIYSLHFVFHHEYSKFINHNSFWRKRTADLQLLLKIKEILKLIVSKHKQCINLFPMFPGFLFFFFFWTANCNIAPFQKTFDFDLIWYLFKVGFCIFTI